METKPKSRAVIRPIPAGYCKQCKFCGRPITFNMKHKPKQIICNVYEGDDWKDVEIYHQLCYDGRYGEAW